MGNHCTCRIYVQHRAVVLGLDDGTLDLSSPFDSTINFSVTISNEEELSGEPLNAPSMENIVFQTIHPFGNILNTSCPTVRKDRDMVISYFERFETEDDYGRTVYQYMGTILTRRNVYSFQYFDKRAESSEEAETALKELLRFVKTKEEYEKTKAESTDDFAPIAELEKQLQSLTLQVESGMSVESNPASISSSSSVNVSASQNTAPAKKEGCYIATAVYGSYDAPEVMTLRRFRDESFLGRMFIQIYYTLSPPIAKRLKNAHKINRFVRNILDKWVDKLNFK